MIQHEKSQIYTAVSIRFEKERKIVIATLWRAAQLHESQTEWDVSKA